MKANREDVNVRANQRYHANEEARKRKLEYKRLWRKANPDKVREAKRRYAQRHGSDQRSRYLDYHRRYNTQTARLQKKRAVARAKYYELHPVRPDPHCRECGVAITWWKPGCGRPPLLCDVHCGKYSLAARLKSRSVVHDTPAPTPIEKSRQKGVKIKRPMPVRYDAAGHRLCVATGCDIVVTHRKKKCTKCRERERREAAELLETKHAGRGRRTDLNRVA